MASGRGPRRDKLVRIPAGDQGIEDRCDAFFLHRRDDGHHLRPVFGRSAGRRAQQTQRENPFRVRARIGRPDHAAERMADDVGLVDAEFFAKRFEVVHQIVERIG
jgi:hypothetical protein